MPAAVWRRRLRKLKDMGCNAIRMSHNPHMPELYDLCDAMGFLVIDEAFDEWEGPKNKWSTGHNVYPPKHQGYYLEFPSGIKRI
ncbi:MAG: glycoside hydrolase family 2 TIM barrel-domain containing protein [Blautia marasmi]